jgi:hypothetical protein
MRNSPVAVALMLLTPALFGSVPSREASPAECMPQVADYTLMWWANGWDQCALRQPPILCIQTGNYGLALHVTELRLLHFGNIRHPKSYEAAATQDSGVVFGLPAGGLELTACVGHKTYRCTRAATNQSDPIRFPVRMVESGRFLQRCDIAQLEFTSSDGDSLDADGRLEIVAWPDRLSFILEITPRRDLRDGELAVSIERKDVPMKPQLNRSTFDFLAAGKTQSVSLVMGLGHENPAAEPVIEIADKAKPGTALPVTYEPSRNWHRVQLPRWNWSVKDDPDRLDRFQIHINNPSRQEQVVRLLFDAEETVPGITGFTPMLRDSSGLPTGIPVQLSKNWHRQKDIRLLYEGAWFHGFTMLRLPPAAEVRCDLSIAWARWGGVPAASHSQLCLIGWGWNQLWDQVAIGSWGESICYEADAIQKRCRIDDVRPLMVWGMGGEKVKWSWTHNVGGGDFLVYYNETGTYVPLTQVKTAYRSHGPNLTDVIYSGVTADGCIRATVNVSTPRCDDLNRAYHGLRYEVLKPTTFKRLAFYQLGSDEYHWHQDNLMARGNESGLIEEWKPGRGGKTYQRCSLACTGAVPWFSLHDSIRPNSAKNGAWANRGLIIRSWKARLGGRAATPFASVYGTEAGGVPSANIELSAPPGLTKLLPGDFVEADLELVIIPMSEQDYYGPNDPFAASLQTSANTWKPVFRQATGNNIQLKIRNGKLVRPYPPLVKVGSRQSAELEITGGVGYLPISFAGLRKPENFRLLVGREGELCVLDQSVHGNDFWQAAYDAADHSWTVTYNVPLDTTGKPQPMRLVFTTN